MLVSPSLPTLPTEADAPLPVSLDAFLAGIGPRAFRFAEAGLRQPHGRQLLAQEGGHDGFYYAKLIKIAASRG